MKRGTFKKPAYEEALEKKRKAQKRAAKKPMKRSGTKSRKAAKKHPTGRKRAPKKPSVRLLKDKLWKECKRIIRARYQNEDGSWNCYTCGRRIDEPFKAQTGHFIPSAACGAYLRYDLRNLRVQDYYCNINLGGNGGEYYKRLVENEGQEYVDQIFKDKQKVIKADTQWYLDKIEEYKNITE